MSVQPFATPSLLSISAGASSWLIVTAPRSERRDVDLHTIAAGAKLGHLKEEHEPARTVDLHELADVLDIFAVAPLGER
jgi:hypothetical protein